MSTAFFYVFTSCSRYIPPLFSSFLLEMLEFTVTKDITKLGNLEVDAGYPVIFPLIMSNWNELPMKACPA